MSLHGVTTGLPQTERAILSVLTPVPLLVASQKGNFLHSIYVADASGSGANIILDIFDGVNAYRLTGTQAIAANGYLFLQVDQRLEFGQTVRATATAANRLHVHVTHSLPT